MLPNITLSLESHVWLEDILILIFNSYDYFLSRIIIKILIVIFVSNKCGLTLQWSEFRSWHNIPLVK